MSPEQTSAVGSVYRVHWIPGTDELRATCHCRAERSFDDPIELWTWLLDHPAGHEAGPDGPTPSETRDGTGVQGSPAGPDSPAGPGASAPVLTGANR